MMQFIQGRKVLGHVGERKVEVPLGMKSRRGLGKVCRVYRGLGLRLVGGCSLVVR